MGGVVGWMVLVSATCKRVKHANVSPHLSKSANKVRFNYVRLNGACKKHINE